MKMRTVIPLFTLLASCAEAGKVADVSCDPLPGWESVADSTRDRYLVIGESHGTAEVPAAVAEYVCAVSTEPTLLAIEWDASDNNGLQLALAEDGDLRAGLDTHIPSWNDRSDGVASEAMLALVERARELNRAGRPVDVVTFNGARDAAQEAKFSHLPGQEPHEASQAENIRAARNAKDYSHVVVLVGGVHARKTPFEYDGVSWEPMAMKLAPPEEVTSLIATHSGGTAWNCIMPAQTDKPMEEVTMDDLDCSAHDAKPVHDGEPGFDTPEDLPAFYDGILHVGRVTASPPVE